MISPIRTSPGFLDPNSSTKISRSFAERRPGAAVAQGLPAGRLPQAADPAPLGAGGAAAAGDRLLGGTTEMAEMAG